jgi:hypothetical protein
VSLEGLVADLVAFLHLLDEVRFTGLSVANDVSGVCSK